MSHKLMNDDTSNYTVAFWQANRGSLDAGPPFNIDDTATNISAALNALNGDDNISQIIVLDNAAVTARVAQLTNDSSALSKLINQNGNPATLNVKDTAAHLASGFATIGTDAQVSIVTVSDNAAVTVTASQVSNNINVLNEIINQNGTNAQIVVKDSAVNLASALDVLEAHLTGAHASIASIVVNNSVALTLSASQIASDGDALALIVNNNGNAVSFKVADTAAAITTNLDALQANTHITTITDTDNAAITVNVAQITADATALSKVVNANASPLTLIVGDTASAIQTAFNTLNGNSQVTKIVVTDSATNEVTISVTQAVSDTAALNELFKADGTTPAHVAVSDTAAHISAQIDLLNSHTQIDHIIVSDSNPLSLTAEQVANDTAALHEIVGSYSIAVSDSAANITAHLDALQANGHVGAIVVSDNAEITVSVTQLASDAAVIGELSNANASTVHVIVADTAGAIEAQIGALNGNALVDKIIVTDSATNEVTVTVAQVGADTTVLNELFQANGTTPALFAVNDTAAHISSAFNALSGNSGLNKIIVSDSATNEVTITVAQAGSDTTALNELFLADGTTHAHVAVSDTAAAISTAFNALNSNSHVDKIIVSDANEVTISVAQAAADTTALGELFQSNGTTPAHVTLSDTAASISGAIDALNANTHVNKFIVSDSATNQVTITAAQAAADTTVLSELFQVDTTTPARAAVSDSAANISSAFDALSANGFVNKIIVNNSGSAEVTITAAQAAADTVALVELFLSNGTTPAHVAVSDTAANISGAFDALNANTHIDKIIVSDSGANEVTITAAQAAADTSALGELFLSNGTTGGHVAVSDTASNIAGAIGALNANVYVNKIIVADSGSAEVTITAAQAAADTTVLSELFKADGTTPAHVAVSDTAANIAGAFNALNANSHVDEIIVSDSATNEVTITVALAASDTAALNELFKVDGTTPAHVAVSDTAASISSAFDALNGNTHVNKIIVSDSATHEVTINASQAALDTAALGELVLADGTTAAHVAVSDTAADISSAFDALSGNSHVNKIIVSDSAGNEVTITAAQAASDTTALNELFNANGSTPASVAVSDTAANVSGAFDALNGNTHVNKIIVSDSSTNEVTISVASAGSDTVALGELFLSNGSTPAHVAVSDSASAISAAFDALNANTHVNKIIVNNGPGHAPTPVTEVAISVAQLASDTTALAELVQTDGVTQAKVAIFDTAADISAAFDTLNGNTQVDHIIVTDLNSLTLTATQVANDTRALGEISSNYTIAVTDTAANITAHLDALQANGHVGAIIVSDNAEITVSVAQLASDATVISDITNQNSTPVHVIVSDTASDISAAFDALSGNGLVNKIIVSDSATHEVTITAAQAAADTTALSELVLADGATPAHVAVSDTTVAISNALDPLSANTHVDKIVVSDSAIHEVSVLVAQLTSDATALGELYNADGTTPAHVAVDDFAASISAAFDSLNSNSQVNKIVVADTGTNEVTISVNQAQSDTTALGELVKGDGTTPANVAISDTAAHISGALDFLNSDTQVDHIIISDNGAITLTVAQATGDATAIGELQNQNGGPVSLTVQDTASAISAALDALNGEANISAIVISDNAALTLNAGQITSDASALSKLSNFDHSGVQIDVVDTAAQISANLGALQANSDIVSITVSDGAPITVTVAQITGDAVVLSELVNQDASPVLLTVRDTVNNIRTNLASLNQNSQISQIIISNNAALKLTVAQITADAHALSIMQNANGTPYTLNIADSAAHISTALDALNGNSHVTAISVTDSAAISLTVAQITSDAHALSLLSNANTSPYTLSVHDAAATISSNFDALNGNAHVAKIVVSDSATHEVTITVTQFSTDTAALADLVQADGTTQAHVKVADTASAISGALNALNAAGQVDKIVVSDSASNEVQVSVAQLTSDATALGELFNSDGSTHAHVKVFDAAAFITASLTALNANTQVDKIIVSDSATNEVLVTSIANITADATALGELYKADGTTLVTFAVSDTAANVTAALDTLATAGRVDKIIVSDSATNEVSVSVVQLANDSIALGELYNADGTTHANIIVSDTAAAISGELNILAADNQVNKIIVSDSATHEVTITAAQLASDGAAIAELFLADGTTHAHVAVTDNAAGISANFTALAAQSAVNKIIVTDSATNEVTITVAQGQSSGTTLNELFNADGTTHANVAISDTAANISAGIAFLQSSGHVDHVIISDGNPLVLNTSQVVHDSTALGKIVGSYTIDVLDTAMHISGNLDALEANPSVALITVSDDKPVNVSIAQLTTDANVLGEMIDQTTQLAAALRVIDTAANIQANLGNLNADLSQYNITQVTISDNAAITLTAAQFVADSAILGDLRNADKTPVQLTVSDTAAHLAADIDLFQTYNAAHPASKISSIVVSNSVAMTLTAAQVTNDAQILTEVTNRNGSQASFKVTDTAAHISANLNQLKANGHIGIITVSDSAAIALSVAQLSSDASVLSNLHNQDNSAYVLNVTDTAAAITTALNSLNGNAHVGKIIVSDSGTSEVHASLFQLNNDTAVFSELFNSDGATHAGVVLTDTSSHIDALTTGQIAALAAQGVNLIDATNDKVIFNVAQYEALNTIKLAAGDTVTVSDTASAFAAMSTADLAALGAQHVDRVILTGSGEFAVDHWNALTGSGVAITTTGAAITIDGTSGNDTISTAGTGSFVLNGGTGADTFNVSATAHDTFIFQSAADSTGANYDTISGYNAATDLFNVANAVTGIDTQVNGTLDSGANFDTELASAIGTGQLAGHHAVLFSITSGNLSGHTFLIVDQNGVAGYQSGQDLVIDVTGASHLASLNTGDFTTTI